MTIWNCNNENERGKTHCVYLHYSKYTASIREPEIKNHARVCQILKFHPEYKNVLGVILDSYPNEGLVFTWSYSSMFISKQIYRELVLLLKRISYANNEIKCSSREDYTPCIYWRPSNGIALFLLFKWFCFSFNPSSKMLTRVLEHLQALQT